MVWFGVCVAWKKPVEEILYTVMENYLVETKTPFGTLVSLNNQQSAGYNKVSIWIYYPLLSVLKVLAFVNIHCIIIQ